MAKRKTNGGARVTRKDASAPESGASARTRSRANPTALRSRALIKEAMMGLLASDLLEDVSVAEVCARSGLTRPTFYNHFRSKEDVVASVIDDVFDGFMADERTQRIESTDDVMLTFLEFWRTEWDLLQVLVRNGLLPLVSERFEPQLERIYEASPFIGRRFGEEELAYHNACLAAGMAGVIGLWARSDAPPSAEELSRYMAHMIAALDAGLKEDGR